MALTVAVTGPTGEIGTSVVRALEQERRVGRVLGMARRELGWAPARTAHETLTAMVDAERDRAAW